MDVYEMDSHGSLPHGGGDPWGRPVPDVTRDEYTRGTALQPERIARSIPPMRPLTSAKQVGTREDVTSTVPLHRVAEPVRLSRGPNEHEQSIGGDGLCPPCCRIEKRQSL